MSRGKASLTAAAIVFAAWLTFLIFLAVTAGKPNVLSRPQFLVAHLYVAADLRDGDAPQAPPTLPPIPQAGWLTSLPWPDLAANLVEKPKVVGDGPAEVIEIRKVFWPPEQADLAGRKLLVRNLRLCDKKYGYHGPGTYLLALTVEKDLRGTAFTVTPVPPSPGYLQPAPVPKVGRPAPIYRDTAETRRQLEVILNNFHGS